MLLSYIHANECSGDHNVPFASLNSDLFGAGGGYLIDNN